MGGERQRWVWVEKNIRWRSTVDRSRSISFNPLKTICQVNFLIWGGRKNYKWGNQGSVKLSDQSYRARSEASGMSVQMLPNDNTGMNGGLTGTVIAGSRKRNESGNLISWIFLSPPKGLRYPAPAWCMTRPASDPGSGRSAPQTLSP